MKKVAVVAVMKTREEHSADYYYVHLPQQTQNEYLHWLVVAEADGDGVQSINPLE